MTENEKQFYLGFGMAIASVAREHGQPFMAADIANCNGVTFQQLKESGLEPFDLNVLREEMEAR